MSMPSAELRARNLRMLGVLAGLFFLPLAVSFWMYYGTDWRPARRVNHGELIAPARALPSAALPTAIEGVSAQKDTFRKKWSLVYIGSGQCDQVCRHALYVMRQTRLSLNNEMTRVARVFLVTGECCDRDFLQREHPGLDVLDASGAAGAALLPTFPAEREHSLFIVDPLGNLMMTYDVRQNPQGLRDDLKKLLSLSHIG
jgi:cytochrome oxidase Cu insertion factor (SCO1/SenC/PrrC family)